MARTRVLLLAEDPLTGGVTSYVLSILSAMRADPRFRFYVAAFPAWEGSPSLVARAKKLGLDVHIFPMSGTFDVRVLGRVRHYCNENKIHVIHTQGYRSTVIATLAGTKRALVNTSHGQLVATTRRVERWEKLGLWAMRKHHTTIAVSDFVRVWLLDQGLESARVNTVHNACPPPARDGAKNIRAVLDEEGERFVVLYAGRLVEGKGLEPLIDAVKEVPDATLLVAGDGPLKDRLKEKARLGGIDARFFGVVENVTPYFDAADVVALTSEMEAMPMVLLEAAAHGRPVIATRVGGIPEIVRDGETGYLLPKGDVGGFKNGLMALRDKSARRKMGEAAYELWKREFTPAALASRLAPIYLGAAGAK